MGKRAKILKIIADHEALIAKHEARPKALETRRRTRKPSAQKKPSHDACVSPGALDTELEAFNPKVTAPFSDFNEMFRPKRPWETPSPH
jgi:hypothetical protein